MKVTYTSHAIDRIRCTVVRLFSDPAFLLPTLITPSVIEVLVAKLAHMTLAGYFNMLPLWVIGYALLSIVLLGGVAGGQKTTPRIVSVVLNREGLQDCGTEPGPLHPWQSFTKILNVGGDTYFLTKSGGFYVPSSAFAGDGLRRRFLEAVLAARRGDYSQIDDGADIGIDAGLATSVAHGATISRQQRRRTAAIDSARAERTDRILIRVLLGVSGLILALGAAAVVNGQLRYAAYAKSPGCLPAAHADRSLSPCTSQLMTVEGTSVYYDRHGSATYQLVLGNPGEDFVKLVINSALYAAVYDGEPVTAKSWRGKIVVVTTAEGVRSDTADYPNYNVRSGIELIVIGSIGVLFFSNKVARERRRRRPGVVLKS